MFDRNEQKWIHFLVFTFRYSDKILVYKVSQGKSDLDVENVQKFSAGKEPLKCLQFSFHK